MDLCFSSTGWKKHWNLPENYEKMFGIFAKFKHFSNLGVFPPSDHTRRPPPTSIKRKFQAKTVIIDRQTYYIIAKKQ